MLKPEFKTLEELRVIGYEIEAEYVRGAENNGAYWTQIDFREYPPFPPEMNDKGDISTWKHPKGDWSRLCYYFGCLTDLETVPEGFAEVTITAGDYAVFCASDAVGTEPKEETAKKVRETSAAVMNEWLGAASGYEYDLEHGMFFEFYKDNCAWVYVPVKKIG